MKQDLEPWVVETARRPLAFAQVREDPLLDWFVANGKAGRGARIIMVASGGCTAAVLAAVSEASHIHLVDPNPAQLALTRLKLHALYTLNPDERLGLFGHQSWIPSSGNGDKPFAQMLKALGLKRDSREKQLSQMLKALGLKRDILGPLSWVAEVGPDHAGRYEGLFAKLRERLEPVQTELHAVLELNDPAEQAGRTTHETALCQGLHRALDDVMALPNLIALFGEGATRNRIEPFAKHFARRTRHALATMRANVNAYLWQMYRGIYPPNVSAPWFTAPAPMDWPEITWSNTVMTEALANVREPFDFVHLSNILDWLSEEEARITLELAAAALKQGGYVFIRQLNSTLDIPTLGPAFDWQRDLARELHSADRSFFYRDLHLGRKR